MAEEELGRRAPLTANHGPLKRGVDLRLPVSVLVCAAALCLVASLVW